MPLSAWDKTRVYGTWYTHAGARIPGTYTVHMPARVTVEPGEAIVPKGTYETGDLWTSDESRPALDIHVPSNDDPDVTPLGWQVRVDVRLTPPGQTSITETYTVDTPVDGEVNLRTIPLAQTIPPTQTMLMRGVAGGVAALDSMGRVLDAQGNPVGAVDPSDISEAVAAELLVNPPQVNATWDGLTGKPPVVAAGTTQSAARSAIGAAASSAAVPSGGTTGQVLAKTSATNHAVAWVDPPAGGGGPVDWDDLPAGSTQTVRWGGTAWPATRPTSRTDVTIIFRGGTTPPAPPTCLPGTDVWIRAASQ